MGKTLIIAEAGVNHNGSIEMARSLIDAAKEAGADYVKFQTAKLDALVSKNAVMADYQKKNTGHEESQKEMLAKLLLPFSDFIALSDYCREKQIGFLSTPFDMEESVINTFSITLPFWMTFAKIPLLETVTAASSITRS